MSQPKEIVLPTRHLDPKLIDLLKSLKTGDRIKLTQPGAPQRHASWPSWCVSP